MSNYPKSKNSELSVTEWFEQLRVRDEVAAHNLWGVYCERLVNLAKKSLANQNVRVSDEEDIAISVFAALCRNAEKGLLPEIGNRDDLWRVLFSMTRRRVIDQFRHVNVQKRGGGRVSGESAENLGEVAGCEISPVILLEMNENYQSLLDSLRDETLRKIAVWKLEGFSNPEIAEKLNLASRTIQRKVQLIKEDWREFINNKNE